MHDLLGWLPMSVPHSLENVNNPRPEVVKAVQAGKSGILHCVDPYGTSLCGKARFICSTQKHDGTSSAIKDLLDMTEIQKGLYDICEGCYSRYGEWKKNEGENT